MFDRFILASNYKKIKERFNRCQINEGESYAPSYNIVVGQKAYVITDYHPKEMYRFHFGLTGIGKNLSQPVPFIRAEGDRNPSDDPNYTGSNAIFLKPEYSNLIRSQRCLVLADAFVVGIKRIPYLVHLRNRQRPFAFAGLWNQHKDETGSEIFSFGIITTPANRLLQELGYKRMPVILHPSFESDWLRESSKLQHILYMLSSYPANKMNAYPISTRITDASLNDKSLIMPRGRKVLTAAISKTGQADFRQEVKTDNEVVAAINKNTKICVN